MNQSRKSIRETEEKVIRVFNFKANEMKLDHYVDIFNCRICHHNELPCRNGECVTMDDYNVMWKQSRYENKYLYRKQLAAVQIGYFMNELLDRIDSVLNSTSTFIYEHYSGHDTTLFPLLSLFDFDLSTQWPPYASFLNLEYFHKEEKSKCINDIYIRITLNNKILKLPLTSHGDGMYSYKEFRKHMMEYLSNIECNNLNL